MAPKKGPAGPTAQEVEDAWKVKEQQWLQEEKQLQYMVQLQQEDARHYRTNAKHIAVEVEALVSKSQYLVTKSTDIRLQFQKQCKALALQEASGKEAMAEQEAALQAANERVHTSRQELLQLSAEFEAAVAANSFQVRAVNFRNSGIAALREKVVKLRNERAQLLADLQAAAECAEYFSRPVVAQFRRKVSHLILLTGPYETPSLTHASRTLCLRYAFDVTSFSSLPSSLPSSNDASAVPATAASSSPSLLSTLAFGDPVPNQRFVVPLPSDQPPDDAQTSVMRHVNHLLWTAANGGFFEDRRLVLVVGSAAGGGGRDNDANGTPLSIAFPVELHVSAAASSSPSSAKDWTAQHLPVIVPLADVFDVLVRRSLMRNTVVAVEVVEDREGQPQQRYVFLAAGCAYEEFEPVVYRYESSGNSEAAAGNNSNLLLAPLSGAGTSLLGCAMSELLDDLRGDIRPMTNVAFAHRLSMALLMKANVKRLATPVWLERAARGLKGTEVDDCGESPSRTVVTPQTAASVFLPPPEPEPLVSNELATVDISFYVPTADPEVALNGQGWDSMPSVHDTLAQLPCHEMLSAVDVVELNTSVNVPFNQRKKLHLLVTGEVSPTAFVTEYVRSLWHWLRTEYGLELDTEDEKQQLLQLKPLHLRCVAAARESFVLELFLPDDGSVFADVFEMPPTLRGADRARAASLRSKARGANTSFFAATSGSINSTAISSCSSTNVVSLAEAVASSFPPESAVRVCPLARMHVTASIQRALQSQFLYELELQQQQRQQRCSDSATSSSVASVVIAPTAAFVPSFHSIEETVVADSLQWKRMLSSPNTSPQQIMVLFIVPRREFTGVVLQEQRSHVVAAVEQLSSAAPVVITPSGWPQVTVTVPHSVVQSVIFVRVYLDDLLCTPEERQIVLSSDASATAAASIPAAALLHKRRVWRSVMNLLPPAAVDFVLHASYPCAMITSTSMQATEGAQAIVIPRSAETRRSAVHPECVFRPHLLTQGVASFYAYVLRTAVDLPRNANKQETQKLADLLPKTWIAI